MLTYDEYGNVVEDDSATDWDDSATLDPVIGTMADEVTPQNVGYFQNKIDQFQTALIEVDNRRQQLELLAADPNITPAMLDNTYALLDEYYDQRDTFKWVANAFNGLAGMLNYVGASVPTISIPSGLGFAPLAIPIGTAVVFTTAVALIAFAYGWLKRTDAFLKSAGVTPTASSGGIFGGIFDSLGDNMKWVVLAGGALLLLVALK